MQQAHGALARGVDDPLLLALLDNLLVDCGLALGAGQVGQLERGNGDDLGPLGQCGSIEKLGLNLLPVGLFQIGSPLLPSLELGDLKLLELEQLLAILCDILGTKLRLLERVLDTGNVGFGENVGFGIGNILFFFVTGDGLGGLFRRGGGGVSLFRKK